MGFLRTTWQSLTTCFSRNCQNSHPMSRNNLAQLGPPQSIISSFALQGYTKKDGLGFPPFSICFWHACPLTIGCKSKSEPTKLGFWWFMFACTKSPVIWNARCVPCKMHYPYRRHRHRLCWHHVVRFQQFRGSPIFNIHSISININECETWYHTAWSIWRRRCRWRWCHCCSSRGSSKKWAWTTDLAGCGKPICTRSIASSINQLLQGIENHHDF